MVDIDLLEQLIESMEEALERLQVAVANNNVDYVNRLRVFIFNVYQQIDELLVINSGDATQNSDLGGENV